MKALAPLFLSLAIPLAACHDTVTKVVYQRAEIPAELLTCEPDPEKPPLPVSEKAGSVYLARVHAAGRDCRATVEIDLRCWNQDPSTYQACSKARREAMGLPIE